MNDDGVASVDFDERGGELAVDDEPAAGGQGQVGEGKEEKERETNMERLNCERAKKRISVRERKSGEEGQNERRREHQAEPQRPRRTPSSAAER
jgi:hypothetical protein